MPFLDLLAEYGDAHALEERDPANPSALAAGSPMRMPTNKKIYPAR